MGRTYSLIQRSDAAAQPRPLAVGVVGAGSWGANLARNFHESAEWTLAGICDVDLPRAQSLSSRFGGVPAAGSLDELLDTVELDAVSLAAPARAHRNLALTALGSDKHLLAEPPLADSSARAQEILAEAERRGLVVMMDHTSCYTPEVQEIRGLLQAGELGDLLYVDAVRINLIPSAHDVDVFWELAPHDLAVLDFILPEGLAPEDVSAHGADPLGSGKDGVGHLSFGLSEGGIAHLHVNWLSPTKIRRLVVGGTKRSVVWDDLNPLQRLSVFDRAVEMPRPGSRAQSDQRPAAAYRLADVWSPALPEREALAAVVSEFADAIRSRRQPASDLRAGLKVVSVLEAAHRSVMENGAPFPVDGLDEPVEVRA